MESTGAERLGYQPALDGLRALAIASVVGLHAFGFPASGALGVDLFFVLSGFLITTLLLEERARTGSVSLLGFYRRRTLRLLPALVVFVGVYLLIALFVVTSARDTGAGHLGGVLVGLLYVSNLVQASGTDLPDGLVHLWSLSAEEQFYALWPAFLLVSLFVLRSRSWLLGALLVAGIVAVQALQLWLLLGSAPSVRLVYGPDARAGSILLGCLLAILLAGRARPTLGPRATTVAVATFAVILFTGLERATFAGPMLVFGVACAALVVIALDRTSPVARALSVAPLVGLGKISYSLYLWHMPILVWFGAHNGRFELRDAAAIVLSVVAAVASYRLIEQPFLRRRRPSARTRAPRLRRLTLAEASA